MNREPKLGDVRRSPDGKRVAIFVGYQRIWPGRPWQATPAQVLLPEDVADWKPMRARRRWRWLS